MFIDHKGQTSLEFLTIVMVLILLAAAVTLFLTSTFDINYAIYETKAASFNFISENQDLVIINNITYSVENKDLTILITFDKIPDVACPSTTDYNYSLLESSLETKTKFDVVNISLRCI